MELTGKCGNLYWTSFKPIYLFIHLFINYLPQKHRATHHTKLYSKSQYTTALTLLLNTTLLLSCPSLCFESTSPQKQWRSRKKARSIVLGLTSSSFNITCNKKMFTVFSKTDVLGFKAVRLFFTHKIFAFWHTEMILIHHIKSPDVIISGPISS